MITGLLENLEFNTTIIRLIFFIGIFCIMAIWELGAGKRALTAGKSQRWINNLGITAINTGLSSVLFPVVPVVLAVMARENGWGLLNSFQIPLIVSIPASIVILDFVIYMQHLVFHAFPPFWRLHMMHHADLDLDVTSGLRFHPVEIIISMGIKLSAVYILGPPPFAVIAFEILLNGTAMFNHSNVKMPEIADRILRLAIVTPDMHRVHHSVMIRETNSNFGFNLSWWDRLFGTYRPEPSAGHLDMTIGMAQHRDSQKLSLFKLLIFPVTGDPGYYAINRWGREPDIK